MTYRSGMLTWSGGGGGSGTVTSVSVVTANGVSGSVANATTTPAITLTLGAITPTSVAATGTVTGSNLSGTNTGDQTITLTGDVTGSGTGSFAATVVGKASGNFTFGGSAQRILADFTNATIANRTMFQTSTVNGETVVSVIPNGTSVSARFAAYENASDQANSGFAAWGMVSNEFRLASGATGTGSIRPVTFYVGGVERFRVTTAGNIHPRAGSTSMTDGFIYVPAAAGAPTGAATAITGTVPLYFNTSANSLHAYNGSWQTIGGVSGGVSPYSVLTIPQATGTYFSQSIGGINTGTIAQVADRLEFFPIIPARNVSVDELAIDVTTLVASSLAKVGIYSDSSGAPNSLIVGTTDLNCATTGVKNAVVATTALTAGTTYWLAVHANSTQTLRGVPLSGLLPLGLSATGGTYLTTRRGTSAYASGLPATAPATTLTNAIAPLVRLRVA